MQRFYAFTAKDCSLAAAPLTHGASHFVIPVLASGGSIRFAENASAASILQALQQGSTLTFMPPTMIYKLLAEEGASPERFPALRHVTYSAAPMPPGRIVEAQQAFGPCVSALYGQTEAPMTITALSPVEMQNAELRGTVGKACGSSEIRIVSDNDVVVSPGEIGHVEVRGPIVTPGYLDDDELTAATIRAGWLRTGDTGCVNSNGYLTLTGRSSELIISGGYNIYPAEIENVLVEAPGVAECCVFGTADLYWGERVDAAVTLRHGCDVDRAAIVAFVKQKLGSIRTPKKLYVVDALPRNAVGKVVRRDMPDFVMSLSDKD